MIQEDKNLVLRDLCARLPYDITVRDEYGDYIEVNIYTANLEHLIDRVSAGIVKMVLRPMSSMTEEEEKEYNLLANRCMCTTVGFIHLEAEPLLDWLNKNMFDYRGLIEKCLAIEVTEENNPYKD